MNILVVEDERNLADAICHILEQEGYNAEAAYDGKTGLAYAESGLYDAAILDVMLPGMDGFSIVRTLRQAQNDLPIMMLTAKTSTRDKVEGLDCGADDYMTKPFEAPRAPCARAGPHAQKGRRWSSMPWSSEISASTSKRMTCLAAMHRRTSRSASSTSCACS